jgi:hypothetical protein
VFSRLCCLIVTYPKAQRTSGASARVTQVDCSIMKKHLLASWNFLKHSNHLPHLARLLWRAHQSTRLQPACALFPPAGVPAVNQPVGGCHLQVSQHRKSKLRSIIHLRISFGLEIGRDGSMASVPSLENGKHLNSIAIS